VSVLMKYALGVPIGTPASQPVTTVNAANALQLSFNRRSPAPVNYTVEASNELSTWTTIATLPQGSDTWTGSASVQETGSGSMRGVTITDPQSISASSRRFLRLRVNRSIP